MRRNSKGAGFLEPGEAFPSLGIGHFIWFPTGITERFEESFPSFVQFCRKRGARVPEWFSGAAPWRTRAEFEAADVRGGLPERMRQWLSSPVALQMQADFIIARSVAALGRIKSQSRRPAEMAARYNAVATAPNGMYALIDYVNFKGREPTPRNNTGGRVGGSGRCWRRCARPLPDSLRRLSLRRRPKGCSSVAWTTARRPAERRAGLPDGGTGVIPIREACDEFLSRRKRPVAQLSLTCRGLGCNSLTSS
ncbi:hypothetical protein ABFY27_06270 [Akkermansia massiliensis]